MTNKITCPICSNSQFDNYNFKDGFAILRCRKCRFLLVDVSGIDLENYYNNSNYLHDKIGKGYVDYEADKEPMRPFYSGLLHKIRTYVSGNRLLDLGSASGYFLKVAEQNGYNAEGIDLNPSAVKEGQVRGRKIKLGSIVNGGYPSGSFEVVTAFDFFEHLPHNQLKNYLLAIKNALTQNGVLAIITVNTASVWARIFGRKWHTFLPPEHISYFNSENLKLLLEENGFGVLSIKTAHKSFSLQYVFNFLYRWQGLGLWLAIARFLERNPHLGRLAIKLPLGDNMLVLAKKRL